MIEFKNMAFAYDQGPFTLRVPGLKIDKGEQVAVIGPSGSGKTTLLHLAAGILLPDAGDVMVGGQTISALSDAARRAFRIAEIGMIFQEFELLDYLKVRENMLLPYRVNAALKLTAEAREGVKALAEAVQVEGLLNRYPRHLSQGERQRVAICRALATKPGIIFADEPTGNLDPKSSESTVQLILRQAAAQNATVVMVTHDHSLLKHFGRVIDLEEFLAPTPAGAS